MGRGRGRDVCGVALILFFSRNVGFSFSYFHFYFRSEEIALEIVDGFRIALQICKLARMLRRHSRGKEESFTVRKKKM